MAGFHGPHEAEGSTSAGDALAATNHITPSAQCGPRLMLRHYIYILHCSQNWVVQRFWIIQVLKDHVQSGS